MGAGEGRGRVCFGGCIVGDGVEKCGVELPVTVYGYSTVGTVGPRAHCNFSSQQLAQRCATGGLATPSECTEHEAAQAPTIHQPQASSIVTKLGNQFIRQWERVTYLVPSAYFGRRTNQ